MSSARPSSTLGRILRSASFRLTLFYAALFIASAGALFATVYVTATALGARLKLSLPLAVLAPIGIHLIFSKLLRVPLPAGLLPMPW